ncbi:probable ribose-5-phosphate isomerase 4, chloroplastic [Solanum dulcamara]|uniref:probable ribose-5-phosphate isomerase 4, chloroplastic n=1 Tax=Solanum dulcamara TaxID=45834 RepID=UPI0024864832|nr:probable ribose-5-phosphate isomerase 4, chloroplastic [Solanum dulcamara]
MRNMAMAMAMAMALPSSASPFLSSTQKQAYFTSSRKSLHRFVTLSTLSESDDLFLAAKHTVDSYVKSGMVVGLGSGHSSALAIQYLGQKLRAGNIKDVTAIPTCVSSASEAAKAGIPLGQYHDSYKIDLAFDEADIMEEETLAAIVGRRKLQGDDSIIKEKTILEAADQLIFIIKEKQFKGSVEGSIPVLIKSVNWLEIAEEIDDLFLGDAEVWRRPAIGYAGPLGGDFPLVTKEGHNILDVIFTSPMESLVEVAKILDQIDGVVEHGVIFRKPCTAIVASENGLQIVDNTVQMESSNL